MTKISKNAAKEFKDKLCVCYSKDDPDTALITTIKDAANHKKDMDEHINNPARLSNICMAEALDIINARTSDAYDKFESTFSKLIRIGSSCYVHTAGTKRPAETEEKQYIEKNAGQRTPFFIIVTDCELKQIQETGDLAVGLVDSHSVFSGCKKINNEDTNEQIQPSATKRKAKQVDLEEESSDADRLRIYLKKESPGNNPKRGKIVPKAERNRPGKNKANKKRVKKK